MVPPDAELLPISLVAHHVFCPRRAWLEAMGETTDTHQVTLGTLAHRAADDPQRSRPSSRRAVDVLSAELEVAGRCDEIEVAPDGTCTVVEHKSTPVRKRATVTDPMRVQLALQAVAARESGQDVRSAAVWFTDHQRRVDVPLDDELVAAATSHVCPAPGSVEARN